jgi:hypothetical protein
VPFPTGMDDIIIVDKALKNGSTSEFPQELHFQMQRKQLHVGRDTQKYKWLARLIIIAMRNAAPKPSISGGFRPPSKYAVWGKCVISAQQ